MKYFLKVPEDGRGQEIFRPKHYKIDAGEEVEVDKTTYDAHNDRNCFETRTESESSATEEKSETSSTEESEESEE